MRSSAIPARGGRSRVRVPASAPVAAAAAALIGIAAGPAPAPAGAASPGTGAPVLVRSPALVTRGVASDATASNNQVKLVRTRGALVAVYAGGAGGPSQVLLATSRDGGAHWRPLGQASEGPVASRLAAIAAGASGRVHVVWTRYDDGVGKVYYREWLPSAQGGARGGAGAWRAPQHRLSPAGVYAGYPAVALDRAAHPQVVWYGIRAGATPAPTKHGSIYEILYTGFDGRAWPPPLLVSAGPPDSINPALASDVTGRLHTVWYQYNGRVYEVRHAEYDGGWAGPEGVARAATDEFNPDVASDAQGRLAVVWEQHEPRGSIINYARRAGAAWGAPVALSAPSAFHPSVATDASGAIWAAWDAEDGQIYVRRYKNGWDPVLRLTADGGNVFPSVLSDGGALDVIWTHTSPAGASVYFARAVPRP